jgi:F-type H+-transporting ATPase subunit delta
MSASKIAMRYAKALFKQKPNERTAADKNIEALSVVAELFKQKEAGRIMRSPVVPSDLKSSLLDYALKQAGVVGGDLEKFLRTVLSAGRIALIPEILSAYIDLINTMEGKAEAELISAVSLPEAYVSQIEGAVSKVLDKKVHIKTVVDSAILGGFIVRSGNYLVDLSLKTKLDGLAKRAVQESV